MKKRKTTPNGTPPSGESDGSLDALDTLSAEMEAAQDSSQMDDGADEAEESEGESFELPDEAPILPLKDVVVYPFAVMPLGAGKERSIRLIDDIMRGTRLVGLVAQKDENVEEAGPEDCFQVGTMARIVRLLRIPDGTIQVIVQGLERFVIDEFIAEQPYLRARVHAAPEIVESGVEIEAMQRNVVDLFQRMVSLA